MGTRRSAPLPKVFEGAFYDFHTRAGWLYAAIPALIGLVALVACYVPARAVKVDPMAALRYE